MPRSASFDDVSVKLWSGLDLRGPAENIPDKSLQSLINYEVTDMGTLKTRPGFQQKMIGGGFAGFHLKFLGQYSNDSQNQIFVQTVTDSFQNHPYHGQGGRVYRSVDSGVTWITTAPTSQQWTCGRMGQFSGTNAVIPTITGLCAWDGTTWTSNISSSKLSDYNGFWHQDRWFTIENSSRNIWFSDPGNGLSYPGSNTIGFTLDNKDMIVGLQPYRDRLLIFFTNSIRVLYTNGPPSSWQMKFLPFLLGVRNQDCYYVYNDLVYFLSSEGFYRTDLTQLEELSKPIAPVFQRRWEAPDLSTGAYMKYRDCIGYWRGRFIISMRTIGKQGGGVPTHRMFMYNIRNGAWSEIVPNISPQAGDGVSWSPALSFLPIFIGKKQAANSEYTKEGLYMTTSDDTGRVFIFDDEDPQYTDAGNPFSSSFKTKDIDMDLPSEYKRSHTVSFRLKNPTLGSSVFSTKYSVNGVDKPVVPFNNTSVVDTQCRIKGPEYFRKFNLEFTDTSSQLTEIGGVTINVKRKQGLSEFQT